MASDIEPPTSSLVPVSQPVTVVPSSVAAPNQEPALTDLVTPEEYYGSTGQKVKAGLEGFGEGVLGSIAPAIEEATGLAKAEDIRGRKEAHPIIHGLGETAGFVGSLTSGLGEASLAGQVGKFGAKAAALAPEASAIVQTGIKAGAELAALATSSELSKLVEHDPNQTLGSAAINIGLSGIIGGAGGVVLGSVPKLWDKAKNVTGVNRFVTDFMEETKALQDLSETVGPEEAKAAFKNITGTAGQKAARWANEKGAQALAKSVGETASTVIGGGLGSVVGHPIAGAWMGEKILEPIFTSLAKPLAENALDALAAKGTADYLGSALKGQMEIEKSVSNLFLKGGEVIAKDLIPDQESRDKLEKSLQHFQNPDNALAIGGGVGHYLPDHASAAAQTAANASNYLMGLKPVQPVSSPLDSPPPIDKAAQVKYNRALDIAQQPLMVLKHVKEGTLLPQDVQTIRTIYPGLHDAIIQKATDHLIDHKSNGFSVPYGQRVSLNMLMGGSPLDGTMTQQAMQAIILSVHQNPQQNTGPQKSVANGSTLAQMNKVSSMYQTPSERRQVQKGK